MAYLIRIKYPLSGFNYHLSDVNVANFNKTTAQFLSNSCFKNGTQKQKFPKGKVVLPVRTQKHHFPTGQCSSSPSW